MLTQKPSRGCMDLLLYSGQNLEANKYTSVGAGKYTMLYSDDGILFSTRNVLSANEMYGGNLNAYY